MPRYARKSTSKSFHRKTGYRKKYARTTKRNIYRLSKRISAVSRRVAGEVCKFESTPSYFSNSTVTVGTSMTRNSPLKTIVSGTPYIYPINWFYTSANVGSTPNVAYANGSQLTNGQVVQVSLKNPVWFNTQRSEADSDFNQANFDAYNDVSPGLQYRLKYIYINALFNASISESQNNTDGALRIVIVKDKQPTGGAATWADENDRTNSRGVFNANRIDAQLNPNTLGRFKIMYDKTLRFNTINGYKPFKYFKKLSTVVRNNRDIVPSSYANVVSNNNVQNIINTEITYSGNYLQTNDASPPIQKNAFYLMMFPDGVNFTYSNQSSTPAASFHLFNRVAYYNN